MLLGTIYLFRLYLPFLFLHLCALGVSWRLGGLFLSNTMGNLHE